MNHLRAAVPRLPAGAAVASWMVWVAFAVALVVRLHSASVTALNPDEAMHVVWADAATWVDFWDFADRIQHPPGFLLLLRGVVWLFGRSDFLLRLPFIVANLAACWFCFAWVRNIGTPRAALFSLLFLACSPAMVSAGTELRQMATLVSFLCPALWALERCLARPQLATWALFGVCILGALLSHYAAVLVLAALALYGVARWPPSGRTLAVLLAAVVITAAIIHHFGALGPLRHVAALRRPPGYLVDHLFRAEVDTAIPFVGAAMIGVWKYLIGGTVVAWLACGVALVGMLTARTRAIGVLLFAPFAVASVMALVSIYPMGQTRHVGYLLPFAAAAFGLGMQVLTGRWGRPAVLVTLLWAALWPDYAPADNLRASVYRHSRDEAFALLEKMIPLEAPLVTDEQTMYLLLYELGPYDRTPATQKRPYTFMQIGGRRILVERTTWCFSPERIAELVRRSKERFDPATGQPLLWLMSAGWEYAAPLAPGLPPGQVASYREVGPLRFLSVPMAQ